MTATTEINIAEEQTAANLEAAIAAAVAEVHAAQPKPQPELPDPWGLGGEPIEIGRQLTREELDRLPGHRATDSCRQRCAGAPGLGEYGYCRREAGHDPRLKHFVINHMGQVVWVWANGEETIETDLQAEPAAVTDPDDLKIETFTPHLRVNYRNKRDVMIVLSAPRKRDDRVEVLDLTHQKFRKVRREMLVPQRDDDPDPTPEQMAWVAEFIAERRAKAYEIADREVTNRRWTRGEMHASVAKIGIAPPPVLHGMTVSLQVDLKVPGTNITGLDQDKLRLAVEAAVKAAAETTLPDGFSVRRVHNFDVGGVQEIR